MKDSIEHLKWRYAVKKFDKSKELSDEKLNILKHAFNLTATSYGLQPIKLVIVKNKAVQTKLVAHTFGQQQVVQASHLFIICIETQIDEKYINAYFSRIKKIRKTSEEILSPFKNELVNSFSTKNIEEITTWATKQAYLALGNLLTICAFEGIDSCPMEGFVADEYDAVLELKQHHLKSVLVLPVGYRSEDDLFSEFQKVRKPLNESIIQL